MKKKILGMIFGALLAVANGFPQTATINWTNTHQTIDGFGATTPLTGDGNPNLTTNQQNFFFGTGSGQLGLSLLRVGVPDGGTGTFGQGNSVGNCSTVSVSCAGGSLPEMNAVISHGGRVLGSPWSPPAAYKTNGSVICTAGSGSGALAAGSYANYATWITNFVKSLSSLESINLYAVSVQNEPNLCPGYDGALYTASQMDTFIKTNLGPTFAANAIPTLIFAPETDNYSGLSSIGNTCFTDSSCFNFTAGVNWHDYDATANSSGSVSGALNPWASLNKKYWETENSCNTVAPTYGPSGCENGQPFITDMNIDGLMWAGLLDDRISLENANAYLYFALVGPTTTNLSLTATNGAVAKRAYVFGQYSAFVRPGYVRLDTTHLPQSGVAVSAYKLASGSNLSIVATNYTASPISQTFTLTNAPTFTTVTPTVTSPSLSMSAQGAVTVSSNSFVYTLPAQSVTTFVGVGGSPPPPPNTPWAGILTTSRAIDWSHNGATIVNRAVQCGPTISPYTGPATTINTAIASCPAGQFVQLGAGVFTLTSTLITTTSNVTLRGMGPTQTFLVWTSVSTNCNGVGPTAVCIWNGDSNSFQFAGAHQTNWTGGYAQGSTNLTVTSGVGVNVGNNVILFQNDDPSDPGDIYVCQTFGSNGTCSQQGGQGVAHAGAAQTQQVTVVAVNGNTITVTPGIYAPNWVSGKNPQFWWSLNLPIVNFGLENVTVDYSHLGADENGIEFHSARSGWVKNIRSINSTSAGGATHKHINIYASNHITVRESYFYGASPTSEGYGVDNGPGSSNNLTENNIFHHLPTGTINETSCCNTIGYNYAVDNFYTAGGLSPNWQQQDGFHHGAGDYYILWEGHEGSGFDADAIHGTSFMLTHFRDYLSGHDPVTLPPSAPSGQKNQATFAYFSFAYNRYNNAVGNVLGGNLLPGATGPYHQFYQNTPLNTTDCGNGATAASSVFVFGYGDQAGVAYSAACVGATFTILNDALVAASQLRWGNYTACSVDAACGSVRFQSSETASAAATYPGLASPSQSLPKSFYLPAIPGFWGSMPWPAVGPDVTGGNIPFTAGHAYHNPAANCYLNVYGGKTDGSTGPINFDANQCYVGGKPLPPSNLTAVAH